MSDVDAQLVQLAEQLAPGLVAQLAQLAPTPPGDELGELRAVVDELRGVVDELRPFLPYLPALRAFLSTPAIARAVERMNR